MRSTASAGRGARTRRAARGGCRPARRRPGQLPSVGLHGDIKLANVALLPDEQVGFIDWQMTLRAPIAVELGWFLVANSGALPAEPDEVMLSYRDALEWDSGRWGPGPSRTTSATWPGTGTTSWT